MVSRPSLVPAPTLTCEAAAAVVIPHFEGDLGPADGRLEVASRGLRRCPSLSCTSPPRTLEAKPCSAVQEFPHRPDKEPKGSFEGAFLFPLYADVALEELDRGIVRDEGVREGCLPGMGDAVLESKGDGSGETEREVRCCGLVSSSSSSPEISLR